MQKSELEPKQVHVLDFIGHQLHLKEVKVRPTLECWQTLNLKIQKLLTELNSSCPNRPVDSYQEVSPPRSAPYETDSVVSEISLEDYETSRKDDPDPKVSHYTHSVMLFRSLQMVQEKARALT